MEVQSSPLQQSQTITPNIKKVLYKNLLGVGAGTLMVVILVIFLYFTVGTDAFLLPLEAMGIEVQAFEALVYMILAVIVVASIAISINFYLARQIKYQFFLDRLIVHNVSLLILKNTITIPYQNLVRITYDFDGIFDMLLKTGTITLVLTGMDKDKVMIKNNDNVEEIVSQIQLLLGQFMVTIKQAKQENEQITNIMDKL